MPGTREQAGNARWFQRAFGFTELSFAETRDKFECTDGTLLSKENSKRYHVGPFELVSLEELGHRLWPNEAARPFEGISGCNRLTFQNLVCDTQAAVRDPANAGAVFQVSSLFNCLQMSEPTERPEDGVMAYADHATQGPVAASCCPAATVFRNYFAGTGGRGQAGDNQLDCLAPIGGILENERYSYWTMKNGYCFPRPPSQIGELAKRLTAGQNGKMLSEEVRSAVQVGVHWDTEASGCDHHICQVFCSAIPVAFTKMTKVAEWAPFACIILEAAYTATLAIAALLAAQRKARVNVFLTALGLGALGNRQNWVLDALEAALKLHKDSPLDVVVVHYANVPKAFARLEKGRAPVKQRRHRRTLSQQLGLVRNEFDECAAPADLGNASSKGRSDAEKITRAFAYFDANGDGVIDRKELLDVLQCMDANFFTEDRVDRLLQEADVDCNGVIHYTEFIAWICKEDTVVTSRVLAAGDMQRELVPSCGLGMGSGYEGDLSRSIG